MTVTPHDPADRERLERLVAQERDARQRDRYRAVLRAMGDVGLAGDDLADELGRSPRFVDEWLAPLPRRRAGRAAASEAAGAPARA